MKLLKQSYGTFSMVALLLAFGLGLFSGTASAANYVVSKVTDSIDGVCDSDCSLREAVYAANDDGTTSTITFKPTVFAAPRKTVTTIWSVNITQDVTITAPAAGVEIAAGNNGNIFTVMEAGATASFTGMTFSGGNTSVENRGTVNLTNCTISGSTSGFINRGPTANLLNCTITGSRNYGIDNGSSGGSGSVFGSGESSSGGGGESSTLTLTNCTVTGNGIGIDNNYGSVMTVKNSIVAGNGTHMYGDALIDGGNNILDGTAAAAGLDPTGLQDNGGPTLTIALLPDSPAIDAANDANAPAKDQRGITRPQGAHSDIGAYESASALAIRDVSVDEGNSGTTNFVFTVNLLRTSTNDVTLSYATADGTASAATDYTAKTGTITIPAGQSSATITVVGKGDSTREPDETFFVNLSNAVNAPIVDAQGIGTIIGDDYEAPSFVVNTTSNVQSKTDGVTSFSDAVAYANSGDGGTITFNPTVFAAPRKTILIDDSVTLYENITITGPAAGVALEGNTPAGFRQLDSIFMVYQATVHFDNVTVSKGTQGIFSNAGTAILTNCTLSNNSDSGFYGYYGQATLTNCTLSGNSIGLTSSNNATNLVNCTLSGNSAYGLYNAQSTTTLSSSTVSGNATGLRNDTLGQSLTLKNSIVAGNTTNTDGPMTYGVNNIAAGTAASAGLETDSAGQPVLKDNDGPTKTIALVPGGAAVDGVTDASAPSTDQRGYARPQGARSDIGAFELAPMVLVINDVTANEGNSGTTGFVFTVKLLRPSANDVTFDYATADGTAKAGTDYTAKTGTITIPAGAFMATIVVAVKGDLAYEPNEAFFVNLSNAVNATISDGQGVGIINTDEFETPSLVVTGTGDVLDNTDGENTLREALTLANSNADASTITFNIPTAKQTSGVWIIGTSGPLFALENTVITGPGAGLLTVKAKDVNKIFTILEIRKDLALSRLTVSNGSTGLANPGTGTLTLTNCIVSGNTTGIYNRNILNLTNCTLSNNSGDAIYNDSAGAATLAGCIANGNGNGMVNSGTAILTNCDLSGNSGYGMVNLNTATLTNCSLNNAAYGLLNQNNVTLTSCTLSDNTQYGVVGVGTVATITNCTISGNSNIGILANSGTTTVTNCSLVNNSNHGIMIVNGASVTLNNSLVVGNGTNLGGGAPSGTNNITTGTATSAGLDPNGLKDNGGPTKTIALLAGSPAIDAANDANAPATDQRGVARPQLAHSDIGAYEFPAPDTAAPTVSYTNSATTPIGTTPRSGSTIYNRMPVITGVAADAGSGIAKVVLRLYRANTSTGANEYWNGSTWSSGTTDLSTNLSLAAGGANATWSRGSWPTGTNLTDGTYYVRALASDKAKNLATVVTNFKKLTDTAVPTVSITTPATTTSVKSLTQLMGTANDGTGGSGVASVVVTLRRVSDLKYWNGSAWVTTVTQLPTTLGSSGWSKNTGLPPAGTDAATQLLEGKYTLTALATDKAGNKSTSARSDFTIDRTLPVSVTITTPVHLSAVKTMTAASGTAADNTGGSGIGRVDLSLRRISDAKYWNGSTWVTTVTQLPTTVAGTGWSKTTGLPIAGTDAATQLVEGKYTLVASAYDKAGNKTTTSARSDFIIDRTLPTVAVTSPTHLSTVAVFTRMSGTAFDAGSGAMSVNLTLKRLSDNFFWNGSSWISAVTTLNTAAKPTTGGNATWSYGSTTQPMPTASNLLDGSYLISARAIDKAGNLSVAASSRFLLKRTASVATKEEAAPAPIASNIQLSVASATADGRVVLTFTGALDSNTALDSARYSVTRGQDAIAVESVQGLNSGTVVLGLEENAVRTGDRVQISFDLKDSKGHLLVGQATVTVR